VNFFALGATFRESPLVAFALNDHVAVKNEKCFVIFCIAFFNDLVKVEVALMGYYPFAFRVAFCGGFIAARIAANDEKAANAFTCERAILCVFPLSVLALYDFGDVLVYGNIDVAVFLVSAFFWDF